MYLDWKKKLNPDLLVNDLKLILTKDRPSPFHSSDEEREFNVRWHTASRHIKKFLLASVGNALDRLDRPKPPGISEPKWFDEVSAKCQTRLVVKSLRNKVLQEGQHVGDYVLEMMNDFDKLKSLGGNIDPGTQLMMILDGLPDCYESVRAEMLFTCGPMSLPEIWLRLDDAQRKIKKKLGGVTEDLSTIGRESSMEESSEESSTQSGKESKKIAKRKKAI